MRRSTKLRSLNANLHIEQLEDRTTPTALRVAAPFALPEVLTAVPERVNVVMAQTSESAADKAALAAAPFADRVEHLGFGIYRVTLDPGISTAGAISYFSEQPNVVQVVTDSLIHASQIPNDPSYSQLWGMSKIDAPAGWDFSTGSGNFVVAVIDTGVDYRHPDLALNSWLNQGEIPAAIRATLVDADGDGSISFRDLNHTANAGKVADNNGNGMIDPDDVFRSTSQGGWLDAVDGDGNGLRDDLLGYDFANDDNDPMDDNNHGTHVAGTIAAVGNNSRGVAGVNWAAQVMPLKFLGANGSGYTSDAVAALNYAVDMGVKVSNNSWGGGSSSILLSTAIARARDSGHIFVAAAGNSSLNIDTNPRYPASYSTTNNNVVAVAATTSSDALASFSNYGVNSVALAAPGSSILSTTRNNTYSYFSGTSMAAPHVAGAIALFWSQHPNWSYTDVIAHLKESVTPVSGLAGKVQTGGRLNVAKLMASSGPVVTAAAFSGETSGTINNLRLTFDRAIDPATFTAADIAAFTRDGSAISTTYTVTPVAGSGNKQFDVAFNTQSVAGTYQMVIGPDIRDTYGYQMNQDGDPTNGESTGDCFTAITTLSGSGIGSGPQVTTSAFSGSTADTFDKVRFTFDRAIDPATFTAADIVSFTRDGNAINTTYTVTPVAGSGNTQFDVCFTAQGTAGTYQMVIGPDIRDTSSNPMNQDGDGTNGETPDDRATATGTLTVSGPKVTAASYSGQSSGTVDKVRFTFDRAIDPATFTAADIVSFTRDGNAINTTYTVTPVAGSGDTQFDVCFTAQGTAGSYQMVIGPDIRDTSSNPMNQDGDSINGETPDDRAAASTTLTTSGPKVTAASYSGQSSGTVDKVRFTFDRAIDPATFTAADIVSFTRDGNAINTTYTVTPVAGSGDTQFDVCFTAQGTAGSYQMVIGPDIRDTSSNPMNQDGDGTNGEVPDDRATATATLSASGPKVTASTFSGSSGSFDKVRFTFDRAIDPATFTAADIISFTGPTGASISTGYTITPVAGSNNTQFDVCFNRQTLGGSYKMVIGPDIRDINGTPMNQDGNGTNGEVPQDRYTALGMLSVTVTRKFSASNLSLPINDLQTTYSTITVPETIRITDVNVNVKLRHTATGNLVIVLKSPTGQAITLFNRRGGTGNNLNNTTFDDQSNISISGPLAYAPFNGRFKPEQPLAELNGSDAQGTWTLEVYDAAVGDTGLLTSWSITITGEPGGGGQSLSVLGVPDQMLLGPLATASGLLTGTLGTPPAEQIEAEVTPWQGHSPGGDGSAKPAARTTPPVRGEWVGFVPLSAFGTLWQMEPTLDVTLEI